MNESARSIPSNSGRVDAASNAPPPYAPSTCSHSPREAQTSATPAISSTVPALVAPADATTANTPSPPSSRSAAASASPVSLPRGSCGTFKTSTSITRAAAATLECTVSQAAKRHRAGRPLASRRSRVPRGYQGRQVPCRATRDEHPARLRWEAHQRRHPPQGLVLGPDPASAVEPSGSDRRGRAHHQVEQHGRFRGCARHERQEPGMVGRDRRGRQDVGPDVQRLFPADPVASDRLACAGQDLLRRDGSVERLRVGDPVARVSLDRAGQLLGFLVELVHQLHGFGLSEK